MLGYIFGLIKRVAKEIIVSLFYTYKRDIVSAVFEVASGEMRSLKKNIKRYIDETSTEVDDVFYEQVFEEEVLPRLRDAFGQCKPKEEARECAEKINDSDGKEGELTDLSASINPDDNCVSVTFMGLEGRY